MRFITVDTMNLFFRMKHMAHRGADLMDKIGLSMHMMLASANKVVKTSNIDHVVFALEGGNNWRKTYYEPYKKPRAAARQLRTEEEVEEDELYFEMYNALTKYIAEHTNCSVIAAAGAEADDVIARFIQLHPDDEHVILSSDTDYYQLLSPSVTQYNGINKELITIDGVYDDNGKAVIDKKTQTHKHVGDPGWILFEKCMRGDKTDNVFSAYPGVRTKGTKNKVGLLEAYADKDKKGYNWNNLMLQRWIDHNEEEHRVLDDYERNKVLIDLTQQPREVINDVDEAIINSLLNSTLTHTPAKNVGFKFMKFCAEHDLQRLAEHPQDIILWLNKPYNGHIINIPDLGAWQEWKKLQQNQL
jgi:5'-3' exonuclease